MITFDPSTWHVCVFCLRPIAPYFISRQPTHAVSGTGLGNNSTYAHSECVERRRKKGTEGRTEAQREGQAVMELEGVA